MTVALRLFNGNDITPNITNCARVTIDCVMGITQWPNGGAKTSERKAQFGGLLFLLTVNDANHGQHNQGHHGRQNGNAEPSQTNRDADRGRDV